MTARVCINCRKVFGCVLMKKPQECNQCGRCEIVCVHEVTGGACMECWEKRLKERVPKKGGVDVSG